MTNKNYDSVNCCKICLIDSGGLQKKKNQQIKILSQNVFIFFFILKLIIFINKKFR